MSPPESDLQKPVKSPPAPAAKAPAPPRDAQELDEAQLLVGLRRGDPHAFDALVRASAPRMLAVARRFLSDRTEAEEALQEAFLTAFRSLGSFRGEARLSTWLHRILVNVCLMKLRSHRRKPEEPLEPLLPTFFEDGHRVNPGLPWRANPELELEREETRLLVQDCIRRLPESFCAVILLRDIEGLDTQEAAGKLGISANAAKIRLHRARQALRTLLAPHFSVRPKPGAS